MSRGLQFPHVRVIIFVKYNNFTVIFMRYLAHIADDGREQSVSAHLSGTAELAAQFASGFGAARDARLVGLLHDIGKYTAGFQARLRGGPRVDHSTAGAKEAFTARNLPAALSIAGHHGGIPDAGNRYDAAEETTLLGRLKRPVSADPVWRSEIALPGGGAPDFLTADPLQTAFYTRMLYSCLVDADFQDTQNFMDGAPAPRGAHAAIPELLGRVRRQAERYFSAPAPGGVAQKRNAVLRACLECGRTWRQGLYTLTVPTGGGKTFASLAFALEHAAAQGLDRVIYVIPYTSIIDQTVSVFSDILGEENVLPHYAGAEYQLAEPEEMTAAQYRRLLAGENWDAPVIVTTAVQFFESLYSNRPSRCRKLHNIARSVVIFDEAQTLPQDYLFPCLSAITQLVQFYGTTAVLCTATQPALEPLLHTLAPSLSLRELCPDPAGLDAALRRTTLRDLGTISQDTLAAQLGGAAQVLCVVNRRDTAQSLYEMLPSEGSYCLTTLLCARDRRAQLAEIRQRLRDGQPCRVVSTSLIEAGVDVDFPAAYREDCGLDSLLQTAGRCNREGKRKKEESFVFRFELEDGKPPVLLSKQISALRFAARRTEDLASPEAVRAYFSELFQLKGEDVLDKKGILPALRNGIEGCALPFAQVAERFHLIETPTRTVYLPLGDGAALCEQLRRGQVSRSLLRRLGEYSVDCYLPQFRALDDAGALELLPDGSAILTDLSQYDEKTGLLKNVETGAGFIL